MATRIFGGLVLLLAASTAAAGDYVVLEAPSKDAGFRAAAAKLAEIHGADRLKLDPAKPGKLLAALRRLKPRYVALVMTPRQIDFGFQREFLSMATRLDDDPFVDFAFGYITGATGEDAMAFVETSVEAARNPRKPSLGELSGSAKKSLELSSPYNLRTTTLARVRGRVFGDEAEHDRTFVAALLPKLAQCSVVLLKGHGFPDQVVGALDAADLRGMRFDGSVILNVACWTGVTDRWYSNAVRHQLTREQIEPERSVALSLLRTGICGYTAYLCPRPVGPELDRDLVSLIVDGDTLGDARRRDYDKTVLGFLGYGEKGLTIAPLEVVARQRAKVDKTRYVMLDDATGGVLFGDPALRPFVPLTGEDPIQFRHERTDQGIVVTASCPKRSLWLHCIDPTARFDGGAAMKVYTRLPLEDVLVADVVVDSAQVGPREVPTRLVWAVEEDHGARFLHLKVMFPRQDGREVAKNDDLALQVTVRAARYRSKARRFGGRVEPPRR